MYQFDYKCHICGGELDLNADNTIGVCQYCGSKTPIPKYLEERGRLYNRAVYLRQNNEFDRAIGVYEEMLKKDNTDAEAHFGLFLSKFGIEFVEDPRTKEKKPTCHRLQTHSVYADSDYKAAIRYADSPVVREVYEADARRVSDVVSRIAQLASNEKPYDIFICYKESDDTNNRTEDSYLAQDLYKRLDKEGYRVFYAKKTLENRLGEEYEPIIFSALQTARIMFVVGTKAEYFNAVWVRNEWSRFSELAAEDPRRVLIPVYKGISAYDLPDELAMYQSQDMNRLGFMEDLLDVADKIVRRNKETKDNTASQNAEVNLVDRKLENAHTLFKLGEVAQAREQFKSLTQEYPDDYRTWLGCAMVSSNGFEESIDSFDSYTASNLKNAFTLCEGNSEGMRRCKEVSGAYISGQYNRIGTAKKNCEMAEQWIEHGKELLKNVGERKQETSQIEKELKTLGEKLMLGLSAVIFVVALIITGVIAFSTLTTGWAILVMIFAALIGGPIISLVFGEIISNAATRSKKQELTSQKKELEDDVHRLEQERAHMKDICMNLKRNSNSEFEKRMYIYFDNRTGHGVDEFEIAEAAKEELYKKSSDISYLYAKLQG